MSNINIQAYGRIRLLIVLILPFITITGMAQIKYKTVNEAEGLQVGDIAENFSALDLHNKLFTLNEALGKGPVVIVFYRGQWCPYCNKHLSHLEDSLQLIYEKGATVVAISPEKPESMEQTVKKTHASFSLLYDKGYKISNQFNLTFRPKRLTITLYNTMLNADLKNAHSDESQRLPIPATFIIGQDGKIVWRHFDPDYKQRSSVLDIVKNIPKTLNSIKDITPVEAKKNPEEFHMKMILQQ